MVKGKKVFQPIDITWSYLYLGNPALTKIHKKQKNNTLTMILGTGNK